MQEKHVTLSNKILYYGVAPCLLLYFLLIDIGVMQCTIAGLALFSIFIIAGIAINLAYKKKNNKYKFEVHGSYAKVMAVLVFFELTFNFMKF